MWADNTMNENVSPLHPDASHTGDSTVTSITDPRTDPNNEEAQLLEGKYIVLKVVDLDQLSQGWGAQYKDILDDIRQTSLPLGSFFVIRDQDSFGPAALHGYAHIVQSFIEGVDAYSLATSNPDFAITPDIHASLLTLANAVSNLATIWQTSVTAKLPD